MINYFEFYDFMTLNIENLKGLSGLLECVKRNMCASGSSSYLDEIGAITCAINCLNYVVNDVEKNLDELWEELRND